MAERTNSSKSPTSPPERSTGRAKGTVEARFRRRVARAIARRHVFRYLAGATAILAAGAGVLVWLIDREDFPTVGHGMWWSLVTLATVGYGDIVPRTTWGRIVGSFVIVLGVTFLSLLTATVTSYFIAADQEDRIADAESTRLATEAGLRDDLEQVLARLEAIEEALRDIARSR
jgi:voltage-gated potassium channel